MRMTEDIEDDTLQYLLWGTRKYLRSIYNLKEGQMASFDGQSIISSLGDTKIAL
ncbi:unnamed protein product [Strongylus vulgaris]|uniref:Uncharacterized protein n=1 Tax=Strongylus vulgaris TaxID=40348 RepID=A0A3P7KFK1_STRVU|nr:unnamed protein product [Strongylus vulgaris]